MNDCLFPIHLADFSKQAYSENVPIDSFMLLSALFIGPLVAYLFITWGYLPSTENICLSGFGQSIFLPL